MKLRGIKRENKFFFHKNILFLYTLESDIRHKYTFDGVVFRNLTCLQST